MYKRMRVILQNRESLLYLASFDRWTASIEGAEDFEHISLAAGFVLGENLQNMDIVLSFGDQKFDIRLPTSGWD